MATGCFDSAASAYEAARGFPPGIGELVAQAAVDWMGQPARVLEVGVGTGRIARPLAALGVQVTGLDLSAQMMRQLRAVPPAAGAALALVQGDAYHLPLTGGVFDALVSVHVFQLLADWEKVVSEVRRVLRPGGVFLNGYEWRPPDSPGARLMDQWRRLLESAAPAELAAGIRDFSDLQRQMLQAGAAYREQAVGEWSTTRTLARHLETIEHRTWQPGTGEAGATLAVCLRQLRSWAVTEFGPLDQAYSVPHRFVWQCFQWN